MARHLALFSSLLVLSGCASLPALPRVPGDVPVGTRSQAGPVVARPRIDPQAVARTAPGSAQRGGAAAPAGAESFQSGPFNGLPRWGFDDEFAEKIARLRVFVSGSGEKRDLRVGGDAPRALRLYTLNLARTSAITFRDVMAQQAVPAALLDCEYRRTERTGAEAGDKDFKPEFIKMFFWQTGARQALSAQMLKPYQRRSDQIADVELANCPPDFASALTAGFGEAAWGSSMQAALQARDKDVQTNIALGLWNPVDYSNWSQNPKALPSAQERALAQEMDKVLRSTTPMTQAYYIALNQQLQPAMAKLAASGLAQAQAIPRGEAGRKAFEQWDAGVGHTVVKLAMRVHASGQPTNLFISVLGKYQALYTEQIADKGALDKAYLAQMLASIAKYKAELDATPAPTADSQRSSSVLVMRPRQSALYRMVNSGVKIAQEFARGRAEIERYLTTLDRDIKDTREAFWACYARRCPEGGVLFYKFSALLAELDRFQIARTAQEGAISRSFGGAQHGQVAMQLLGMDRKVNDNYVGACDGQYDRFLSPFVTWMSLDATTMRRRLEEALAGDDYLQVQQCRDRMEFIMRPRPEKSGLL